MDVISMKAILGLIQVNADRGEGSWKGRRLYCFKCGHSWASRTDERPDGCPKCRSRRYDVPSGEYDCPSCGRRWSPKHYYDECPGCGRTVSDMGSEEGYACNQCGHRWIPRGEGVPLKCPKCKARSWNEPKMAQFVCHKCGYVWKSRMEYPNRCPECRSETWDKDTFKLKCFRCGHKWILNEGSDPDMVRSCPSCRSRKWNEPPRAVACRRCGSLYVFGGKGGLCPECRGESGCEACRCGFCGTEWVSADSSRKICPVCGIVSSSEDGSEKLLILWEKDGMRLNYLFKDGIGCVYLWYGSRPETCRYLNEVLEDLGVKFGTLVNRAGSQAHRKFWESVAEDMLSRRDAYKENVPYFMRRLGIGLDQAEILALHFTGMSPEAISLRSRRPLKEIRTEFTRIQEAFSRSGIVVNDSVFTEDPISCYDQEGADGST